MTRKLDIKKDLKMLQLAEKNMQAKATQYDAKTFAQHHESNGMSRFYTVT